MIRVLEGTLVVLCTSLSQLFPLLIGVQKQTSCHSLGTVSLIRSDRRWVANYLGVCRWVAAELNGGGGGGEGNENKVTLGKEQVPRPPFMIHLLQRCGNPRDDNSWRNGRHGDSLQSQVHMNL